MRTASAVGAETAASTPAPQAAAFCTISTLARANHVPLLNDLGSGTLVDLARYGLTHEQTVAEAVAEGADLVTFSGDKLLGGPQAGFIVGRRELIARLNRNPLKRALRIDKIRLAAIEATLRLYRDPDRLAERLPTLRMMVRPRADIEAAAQRLLPDVAAAAGPHFTAETIACASQIGSGSLPAETVQSAGIALRVVAADLPSYEAFLKTKLTRLDGIASIESSFALSQVKYSIALPV